MRFARKFSILLFIALQACSSWHPSSKKGAPIRVDSGTHSESETIIRPYRDSLQKTMKEVIGRCEIDLYTQKPQGPLGNFVCDLLMEEIPQLENFRWLNGVNHFTLLNTRGFRAPIAKGEIKVEDVYAVMPFENEVVLMQMPVETLDTIAQSLVAKGGHPISGNATLISFSNEHAGLSVNGTTGNSMWIITTDYLAEGGDGMSFFSLATKRMDTGIRLRDIIIEHIKKRNAQGKPIHAINDERILFFR
jgi:2',3'-cyclic-nucleotide 2'-phosphodiesterase (5'-nucleotidase family)